MKTFDDRIAELYEELKGKWPSENITGVIEYDGLKIKMAQFTAYGLSLKKGCYVG